MRRTNSYVKLEDNGNGQVEVRALYTGLQQESRKNILHNSTNEAQKKWLTSHINLPSMELQRFELTEGKGADVSITEKLTMNVRSCATKTGTRLFVKSSLLSRPIELPASAERTTDFYLPESDYDFSDLDSVFYSVPKGYKLETTLPAFQVNSIFGAFTSKVTFENNQLICSRKMMLNGGRYKASDYPVWVDFLKKIRKADRAQVVFVESKD